MANLYPLAIQELIDELGRLPGIGRKTAARLAFHLLNTPDNSAQLLANAILKVKKTIRPCSICFNLTDGNICTICKDSTRQRNCICIVEDVGGIYMIEKTKEYNGLYHVLGGVISPLDGVSADDLKVSALLERIKDIEEIILALNPSTEGEATSIYLSRLLKPKGVKITRLARGIPLGSNLEFIDELTLSKALNSRMEL